jgi:hypothetical protein
MPHAGAQRQKKSLLSFTHYKIFIRLDEHFNEGDAPGVSNVTVCVCVCVSSLDVEIF